MTSLFLVVSVDGQPCHRELVEFSACGELTVRVGEVVLADAKSIECQLFDDDGNTRAHVVVAAPAAEEADGEEWQKMPSARNHERISAAVDVTGYTICIDCTAANSSSRSDVLRAIRVVRQHACAPASDPAPSTESHGTRAAPDDAMDADDAPTLEHSVHGEWLRTTPRPGPPARCWVDGWLAEGSAAALRRAACALVHTHGLGGRTFWMSYDEPPRCSLERFALEVLAFHRDGAAAPVDDYVGAEWWVQMRSTAVDAAGAGDDGASIAFHFDCDEGAFTATGELIPPWLSTVTYLGVEGAPTLILPARPDVTGETTAVMPTLGAYVSYPVPGKHLCFDGTLLHGCPHTLALPPTARALTERKEQAATHAVGQAATQAAVQAATQAATQAAEATQAATQAVGQAATQAAVQAATQAATQAAGQAATQAATQAAVQAATQAAVQAEAAERCARLRVTLLVNLWRRHRPCGPQPLQQRVAATIDADGGVAACRARGYLEHGLPVAASVVGGGDCEVMEFLPSAARKRLSPAARGVTVCGLPSARQLADAAAAASTAVKGGAGFVSAPWAALVGVYQP